MVPPVAAVLLLLVASAAQEPAKDSPAALEAFIRVLHQGMRSKDPAEQLRTLNSMNPTRKDVDTLFPAQAEKLWPMIESRKKLLEDNLEKVAAEFTRGGEIQSIELKDVRAPGDEESSKALLEMIPKTVAIYDCVVKREKRTSSSGSYLYVNDHWVFIKDVKDVPKIPK
jgi:hypothetical protein